MNIKHHFGGSVYLKETHIPAGHILVQHKHVFDHLSFLASGTVEVQVGDERQTISGPSGLVIEAGKHHGVKALTDTVWLCIHATDCTDAGEVDETLIEQADQPEMLSIVEAMR